jgi:hypothetical protein
MLAKRSPLLDEVPDRGCHFGGGGSSGGGTQTTVQKSDPWAGQQPFLQQVYGLAQGAYGSTPMNYFPGQTYANLAPETEQALRMQAQRAQQGSPLTGAAQGELTKTLSGGYLDPTGNPAFQKAAGDIQSRIGGMFSSAGRYGSGAMANQANEALSNLAAQTYQGERDNMMKAGLLAPQIAQQDYFDASKLAEVGGVREDFAQQGINEQMARHQYNQMEPWTRLQLYNNLIQGNVGGQSESTTSLPRRSLGAGDVLGGAAGLAGILGMMGVFSDERVKEDIQPVGETYEGLPIYTYKYKWGGPTHMGVMAQEVEQVHPEAVGNIGGVKTVRYDLLGMLGGS